MENGLVPFFLEMVVELTESKRKKYTYMSRGPQTTKYFIQRYKKF